MTSRAPQASPRAAVLTALGGVAAGVLIFLAVLAVAGPKSTEQARDAEWNVGSAERLAASVERDGPLLFQDLLNRSRDVFVQHLGGEEWRVFDARPPGAPRTCVLMWRAGERLFADPCSGRTFPPDGSGLPSYPARVDDEGVLIVDLTPAGG